VSADLDRWLEIAQQLEVNQQIRGKAEAILADAGFEFTVSLWDWALLKEIADLPESEAPPEWVTRELHSLTVSEIFMSDLLEKIASSGQSAQRGELIKAALQDHRSGRYASAVVMLLPQMEGLLTDILVMAKYAQKEGSDTREIDASSGNGRILEGLGKKAYFAKGKGSESARKQLAKDLGISEYDAEELAFEIGAYAKHMAESVLPRRNDILHGSDCEFGTQQISTWAVLWVYCLVRCAQSLGIDSGSMTSDPTPIS
jgi:hypothetical protein